MAFPFDAFLDAYDRAFVWNGKPRLHPNTEQILGITPAAKAQNYLVAGPCTGKTYVLTLHLLKPISRGQISSGAILANIFNNVSVPLRAPTYNVIVGAKHGR